MQRPLRALPVTILSIPYYNSKQHDPRRVLEDARSPSTTVTLLPCILTDAPDQARDRERQYKRSLSRGALTVVEGGRGRE
ncbi:hypothetical protein SISSUDRAFT_1055844 [Sistotremastrum suecicum HHB10207 ss-3]|uniref:Uncharacterized protein n=1 Tax=Sistotremastrum suecicum HHB10207 ss-3 TaxID=1314776 RepID=A0A165XI00_9AGAM|nr:hypothetical protein SISSUDRAFT_1055844 [Sistotremastrum suecicum HHB10207 ss-3]